MKLNKIAATAAMAAGLGSAALGIGAGLAQADPGGGHGPGGPNVPGPNVPGPNVPVQNGPGNGPKCEGQGANALCPGSPLPPGQGGIAPPPGHYNDPVRYGLPTNWPYQGGNYPIVFNPDPAFNTWGIWVPGVGFVPYTP